MLVSARDRLARLLSVIPWVADQPDGVPIDDIVARFAYPRTQLLEDLQEIVFFVGVHPFTPDSLIEVDVSDDQVSIRYADWFSRPLRLSPEDGARLLTAGRSVLAIGATDETDDEDDNKGETDAPSPLLRALTKLGTALGEGAERAVDVRLGTASADTLGVLRDALDRGVQVELEYYSYGRDELSERRVEPAKVFSDQGNWYLSGWCPSPREIGSSDSTESAPPSSPTFPSNTTLQASTVPSRHRTMIHVSRCSSHRLLAGSWSSTPLSRSTTSASISS